MGKLKELKSWLENKTGKVSTVRQYVGETGLRPIPSRWVIEWKRKEGVMVIKCRLCAKGFAEQNQHAMHTYSPAATKLGHRMVAFEAARNGWEIWSLDVSTAFLKGATFSELNMESMLHSTFGHTKRQPCALKLPVDVWELLCKLEPRNKYFKQAKDNPSQHCFVLDKAVYGLKDAPLLWFLRAFVILVEKLGLIRSKHDVCVFYWIQNGTLVLIISLHVDDTLASGTLKALEALHKELQKHLGDMKAEKNFFRHFGVDICRDPKTLDVKLDQSDYIKCLRPIDRKKTRGRTVETDADASEITSYRSLVSGMAWVGITSPLAQAVASLLQTHLPQPKLKHLDMANNALEQLSTTYVSHTFKHGFDISSCKLLQLSDSSLGNVANNKKSQGGFLVFLCEDLFNNLCGYFCMLAFRSGQSKRVANSTMNAEALAKLKGMETCLYIQTWLYEIDNPTASAHDMTHITADNLIPIESCTDCHDLYDSLLSPAQPNLSNLSMTLHLSTLREMRETNYVRSWVWLDTDDMLANGLTKLNNDGTLPIDDLSKALKTCYWKPTLMYKYNNIKCWNSKL